MHHDNGNRIAGLIVLIFIFVPMERLFALRKEQKILRRQWWNDIIHFLANRVVVDFLLLFAVGALVFSLHWLVSARLQAAVAAQPRWLQFIESVVLADLGFYVAHRLTHTVPFLWKFHAVHHSIEEMDWLASARVHPLDQVFTKTMTILPLYILGFTKETLGFYLVITGFQSLFIHSNVRFRFGPLRWLMGTPEFHHWHHAGDAGAVNKNFAGQVPLLDWLFGTLYLPKNEMPKRYGIPDPVPTTYLKQLAYPFQRGEAVSQAATAQQQAQQQG